MLEGYTPIAVRNDRNGNTALSFNPETKKFLLAINGELFKKPLTLRELEVLRDNFSDVLDMHGRYLFLEKYDLVGNENK